MLTKVGADIVIEVPSPVSLSSPHSASTADLLALPGGGFTAIWVVRDLDQINPSTDFKFKSFGVSGAAETTILHSPQALSIRGALALTSPTTVAVFSATGANELREFNVTGGPQVFGPDPIMPNDAVLPSFGDAIATSGGKTLLVYRAEVGGVDQLFARSFSDANTGAAPVQIFSSATDQFAPSIARLTSGNVAVGYGSAPNSGDIGAFVINENGALLSGSIAVNQAVVGMQNNTQVAALTSGGFVVTWVDHTGTAPGKTGDDVRSRVFDNAGNAITVDFRVNTGVTLNQYNADVASLSGGRFAVVWESDAVGEGHIIAQVFDRLGSRIGGEVVIQASAINNWFQSPKLEMLADGRLVIAMTNDKVEEGIIARIYDPGKLGTAGHDVLSGAVLGRVIEGLAGNDTITGTALVDTLDGGTGNDTINGGVGRDRLVGGTGNDTFFIDSALDIAVESVASSGGTLDHAKFTGRAGQSYTMATGVELLTLLGSTNSRAVGNASANTMTGNAAANILNGGAGTATDILDGKGGKDVLTGGAGRDFFVFSTAPSAGNTDRIIDFRVADDTIRLENSIFGAFGAKVGAAQFLINTTGLASATNDYLIYEKDTGELYYDSNGSRAGGSVLVALLPKNLLLTAGDFAMI